MFSYTNRSVPGGCVIGLLALFPATLSALGAWGLFRWATLPAPHRHFDSFFWLLVGATAIGALLAVALIFLALRVLRSTDFRGHDPRDPNQNSMKW